MSSLKRAALLHDLSGVGRCSLTVIMPVLSVLGVQACPVPTSVFSTHTGGFGPVAMRDLTDYLPDALAQYRRLGLQFDCVYSGFLASAAQIDGCLDYLRAYPKALKVVDPVMGDHGLPYRTMTPALCSRMRELAAFADVLVPNRTEAALLLERPYDDAPLSLADARALLLGLSALGPARVVLSGVPLAGEPMVNLCCELGEENEPRCWASPCRYIPAAYPGTGDLFAAVMTGALLAGKPLAAAVALAGDFVSEAIAATFAAKTDSRHGVLLEPLLGRLLELAKNDAAPDIQIL